MLASALDAVLQGQSSGSSTWKTGSLSGWNELDYVPARVFLQNGPASNQVVSIQFQHSSGTLPIIQNLSGFSNSANVVITSAPILSAPAGQDMWSYTFSFNVINNGQGFVSFLARLSAGAHLSSSNSFPIQGAGSLGTLKISRPSAGSELPDLVVKKTGPATAAPGDILTYTVNYFNKTNAQHHTDGVQLSDFLPGEVIYVANSATPGANLVGNTLTWDFPVLDEGSGGTVSYQVRVNSGLAFGTTFSNLAEIYSSDNDENFVDNSSSVTTRVAFNRPPVANDDSYSLNEDAVLSVPAPGVMANDTDPDGKSLTAILVAGPSHGLLSFSTNGSFSYMPAPNYDGPDGFTYQVSDGVAQSGVATVTLTVIPVNHPPQAFDDAYSVNEDAALNIPAPGVLANDTDVDGDSLTAILVSGPLHGSLVLNADGSFHYLPGTNYNGQDSFTYKANDGMADSGIGTVRVTVMAVNHAPVAYPDQYVTYEDRPLAVMAALGVLANDIDVDGDQLQALLVKGASHGMVNLNDDGSFIYTPAVNFNGSDSFAYQANDGILESAITTVTITVLAVNHPPSFTKGPDQLVNEDAGPQTAVSWATGISAGPPAETNQTVTFTVTSDSNALFAVQPAISTNGTLTYTPAPHAYGIAHLTVTLQDSGGTANGGSDTSPAQTFTITVNAPPTVNIVSPTNGTTYFAPAMIAVIADAYDVDGTVSKVEFFGGTNLLAQTNPASYFVIWTNVAAGSYQFTAKATDNHGASAFSSPVSVTVLERPPSIALQPVHFNPQTGLFEEVVQIDNPSQTVLDGVRVMITGLRTGVSVFNPSGKTNGIWYVQSTLPIPPGPSVDLKIEYYVPDYQTPNPILTMEVVPPTQPVAAPAGILVPVTRKLRFGDGSFLVEFNSLSNRVYFVQYSLDMVKWKTAWPSVTGIGNRVQWVDNGPPRTEGLPTAATARFYRILLAP